MSTVSCTYDKPPVGHGNSTAVIPSANAVPDAVDSIRELGDWLNALAPALGRMSPAQRRELIRCCRNLRGDLAAIRLGVPVVTR